MLSDSSCYKILITFHPTEYKPQLDKMLNRGLEEKWITEHEFKCLTNPIVPVLT